MKYFIPGLLLCFIAATSASAQDVRLNDSVIFINDKPVALYAKTLNSGTPGYNMEVYSFDDYVLIKAEAIKFNTPVTELEPFYYYELTFPPTGDTFAIYFENKTLPLELAGMIKDYDLIYKNQLNKKNVSRLIASYQGGQALNNKIRSMLDYLDTTRNFNVQVERDRTMPVNIIDNNIMQDGFIIGKLSYLRGNNISNSTKNIAVKTHADPYNDPTLNNNNNRTDPNNPLQYYPQRSNSDINFRSPPDQGFTSSNNQRNAASAQKIVCYVNGRSVIFDKKYDTWKNQYEINSKKIPQLESDRNLYQKSKAEIKNIDTNTDQLLLRICSLIADYRL
jgi:hypothetical protein